jgi:hypothetical protein
MHRVGAPGLSALSILRTPDWYRVRVAALHVHLNDRGEAKWPDTQAQGRRQSCSAAPVTSPAAPCNAIQLSDAYLRATSIEPTGNC